MLPSDTRHARRSGRAGRQTARVTLERLEERALMAYTPLGFSLPDLTISGYNSSAAAWGAQLTVTVDVRNLGASSLTEPTALQPGATSTADAQATTVAVYLSTSHHVTSRNSVFAGTFPVPVTRQNSFNQVSTTLTLPSQPKNFPGDGGKVFVSFIVNPTGNVNENDYTNNAAVSPVPVHIQAPFPELVTTGLDLPPVMQPGDTIQPTIRITNVGPASTGAQGPLTVDLVASTTRKFTSGSSVIARFSIANVPGISLTSSGSQVVGDANLVPQNNTVTFTSSAVTLPVAPKKYFVGVVIDPAGTIKQLHNIGGHASSNTLSLAQRVGPPIKGLPPAGVVYAGGGANNLPFPYPPNVNPSGTTVTSPQTGVKTS